MKTDNDRISLVNLKVCFYSEAMGLLRMDILLGFFLNELDATDNLTIKTIDSLK